MLISGSVAGGPRRRGAATVPSRRGTGDAAEPGSARMMSLDQREVDSRRSWLDSFSWPHQAAQCGDQPSARVYTTTRDSTLGLFQPTGDSMQHMDTGELANPDADTILVIWQGSHSAGIWTDLLDPNQPPGCSRKPVPRPRQQCPHQNPPSPPGCRPHVHRSQPHTSRVRAHIQNTAGPPTHPRALTGGRSRVWCPGGSTRPGLAHTLTKTMVIAMFM